MRIDAISIFPQFFDVLDISLLGKAKTQDLLDVKIHDLRDFTDDKHRTVDDTPFGGGAGMLMKAEPWGQALDSVMTAETIVIFPSPAGELFNQRVVDYAASKANVRLVSLGDYVLNGGEVAAVAMIEAIARLIPGVIGNADSLTEESHSDGLLEYPSYTKPSTWRGLEVPEVLLGGNHAEIAKWRKAKALERTQQVRPELLD